MDRRSALIGLLGGTFSLLNPLSGIIIRPKSIQMTSIKVYQDVFVGNKFTGEDVFFETYKLDEIYFEQDFDLVCRYYFPEDEVPKYDDLNKQIQNSKECGLFYKISITTFIDGHFGETIDFENVHFGYSYTYYTKDEETDEKRYYIFFRLTCLDFDKPAYRSKCIKYQ